MFSLAFLLPPATACVALPLAERATVIDSAADLKSSYDYVVIDGGTSGLSVANRLTEDPQVSVLVIEYGPLDTFPPGALVPGLQPPAEYSRNYMSVPQKGTDNRPQGVYTGAVVGGGTVINGLFFTRGSQLDYDAWEHLGNPGWNWAGLLPYFRKVCTASDSASSDLTCNRRARISRRLRPSLPKTTPCRAI